jgi:hypothetical protein
VSLERQVAAVQAAGGGEIERAEDVVADRGFQDGGREDVQDVGGDSEADQPGVAVASSVIGRSGGVSSAGMSEAPRSMAAWKLPASSPRGQGRARSR